MMKKLLYTFCLLSLLVACRNEDSEPELLVVTAADLVGTWVFHDEDKGATEIMKFTADGEFYLTNRLDSVLFEGVTSGSYSFVSVNASVMANYKGEKRNFSITGLSANSITLQYKSSGDVVTFSRLATTLDISYDVSIKLDYGLYVSGTIKGYHSHNDKTASVDKTGTIVGKSEGLTLVDVITNEGTAVVIVKVGGLIYDYTQAIGLSKDEVCTTYGEPNDVTEETVYYRTDEKMTTYNISKRTKKVDAIYIIYSKKGFSNSALVDYLSNKYYAYKAETIGTFYAFTNEPTYDISNVKITYDGSKHLTYAYVNHDLFEDFSIALGKSRSEVAYMYGDDLELLMDQTSFIEYAIGDEIQGYPGADIMEEVKFSFDSGVTKMVELRLHSQLKQDSVVTFLKSRYDYKPDLSSNRHQYYYDEGRRVIIDYMPEDKEIRYYIEE